jgi:phenylpyruvate tautomerase PptA (4-oxalocrotonate tautomerase family)
MTITTMPIRLFAVRLAKAMTEDIAKILNIKKVEVIIVFQEAPHGN